MKFVAKNLNLKQQKSEQKTYGTLFSTKTSTYVKDQMTTSKKFEQVISLVVICSSSSKKAMENNFKLNATKNLENTQRTKNPKKCN